MNAAQHRYTGQVLKTQRINSVYQKILTNFFSGALIPLSLFPAGIRELISLFPFGGIVYIPCSIFIGSFSTQEAVRAILFQIIWNVLLFLAGGLFWKKASAVISLYGG